MAREKIKNVTNTVTAPPPALLRNAKTLSLIQETTQKLFSRASLQWNQKLRRDLAFTAIQKPYRNCKRTPQNLYRCGVFLCRANFPVRNSG